MKTAPAAARARAGTPRRRRPVVLVVEDDPLFRRVVQAWLSPEFEVMASPDGRHLAADIAAVNPDALVMDMGLPGKDGPSLCRELRAHPWTAGLPVVFLTSRDGDQGFIDHVTSGGDAFLSKSSSPELLKRTLWGLLQEGPEMPKGT